MIIAQRAIGLDVPPYVIAEIGVNHDGDLDRALGLVDAARAAHVDAVKLQFFDADLLLSRSAKLAEYQAAGGESDPFTMLKRCELTPEELAAVVEYAHHVDLAAIVTVFSPDLVPIAERMPFDAYKTASTDLVNRPLIDRLLATGKPLLLSTGAATIDEVRTTTSWLGAGDHLLLHCVSRYPTPDDDAALGARAHLLTVNPNALGYSDHTQSLDTGALAVAGGACLLEKHLTYDRAARGPDHSASLDPDGLAEYVRLARRAWRMRGPTVRTISDAEVAVRDVARQSLTTVRDLPAGHVLTAGDLTVKRPGTGLAPARLSEIEGRTLAVAVGADEPLCSEHLS